MTLMARQQIYYRYGKQYKKLERHEVIKEGAMHNFCFGELMPLQNPETIGQTPADFSDEREFFNPIEDEKIG